MAATYAHEQFALSDDEKQAMEEMTILCRAAEDKTEQAMILACEQNPEVEGLRQLAWAYIEYGQVSVDADALIISPSSVKDKSVAQVAVILLHEWQHVKRDHHARWKVLFAGLNEPMRQVIWHTAWNYAADCEINSALINEHVLVGLQDDSVVPGYGDYKCLPAGLTAEEYFDLIKSNPALWAIVDRHVIQKYGIKPSDAVILKTEAV